MNSWKLLADVPKSVNTVYDNQNRKWEREGTDWATYGSFIQRWSTAITDLSGWGPFTDRKKITVNIGTATPKAHRIQDPKGIGGVSATYHLHQQGDTLSIGPLHHHDDALMLAERMATLLGTRWDVVEEKITHTTIAAYGVAQQ